MLFTLSFTNLSASRCLWPRSQTERRFCSVHPSICLFSFLFVQLISSDTHGVSSSPSLKKTRLRPAPRCGGRRAETRKGKPQTWISRLGPAAKMAAVAESGCLGPARPGRWVRRRRSSAGTAPSPGGPYAADACKPGPPTTPACRSGPRSGGRSTKCLSSQRSAGTGRPADLENRKQNYFVHQTPVRLPRKFVDGKKPQLAVIMSTSQASCLTWFF